MHVYKDFFFLNPNGKMTERLSNLEEVDWYLLQQLTESIQMQESGPREAVETVRKKLKHGGTQQKLRVLEVRDLQH